MNYSIGLLTFTVGRFEVTVGVNKPSRFWGRMANLWPGNRVVEGFGLGPLLLVTWLVDIGGEG